MAASGNNNGNQMAASAGSGVPVRPGTAVSSGNQGAGMAAGYGKTGMTSSKGFQGATQQN